MSLFQMFDLVDFRAFGRFPGRGSARGPTPPPPNRTTEWVIVNACRTGGEVTYAEEGEGARIGFNTHQTKKSQDKNYSPCTVLKRAELCLSVFVLYRFFSVNEVLVSILCHKMCCVIS